MTQFTKDSGYPKFELPGAGAPRAPEFVAGSSGTAVPSLDRALEELPEPGSDFLDFHLLSELGRGAFSRVYLAQQGDLANRLVALKISAEVFGEPQMLAQLQHTNIVPVYSVHQAGLLQAVCMPYFGPTTLADVLKDVHQESGPPASGAALVSMLKTTVLISQSAPTQLQSRPAGNARGLVRVLQTMTYVRAVLWVGARLADGLAHAHERGILHRDLKPANVLLSDDGQPMLLDFNLSEDVKRRGPGDLSRLGGTLPYMAPEHLEALRGGQRPVDDRSDIYALGVLLYELLTGRLPFATPSAKPSEAIPLLLAERHGPAPSLSCWNRDVTPAVESIVRHCLEPDPARRYQTALELREDLQRQLDSLPLLHAPEPSVRERAGKWARRHPRLASPLSLGTLAALVAALVVLPLAWLAWEESHHVRREANEKRQQAEEQDRRARQREDLMSRQAEATQVYQEFCRHVASLRELEAKLNLVELLPDDRTLTPADLAGDEARCRAALDRYGVLGDANWRKGPLVTNLPAAEQTQLCCDAAELLDLLGRANSWALAPATERLRQVGPVAAALTPNGLGLAQWAAGGASVRARGDAALRYLNLAAASYPGDAPFAFRAHRELLAEQLGGDAAIQPAGLGVTKPKTGPALAVGDLRAPERDLYWDGYKHASREQFAEAVPLLRRATTRAPQNFSAWFLLAVCHLRLEEDGKAADCFSTCIALKPAYSWARVGRGLARLRQRDWPAALDDFDTVLRELPDLASAYRHRARALMEMARYHEAIEGLSEALQRWPGETDLYFLRAELRRRVGDLPGATADLQRVLETEPTTADGWTCRGLARLARSPAEALEDFETALRLDPECKLALLNKARLMATVQGRREEAVGVLDLAVAAHPDDMEARVRRGLLLAHLGDRARAHADAETFLRLDPTPARQFQAACIYALTSRNDPADARRALDLLTGAVRQGHGLDLIRTESALDPLRDNFEFRRLELAARILEPGQPGAAPGR